MATNPVQQKISCVYVTGVSRETSSKRNHQPFKVSASRNLTEQAVKDDITTAKVTEKLDGTCCLIQEFQGQPWLWARHDRKPNKAGERRFAQYNKSKQQNSTEVGKTQAPFVWNISKDFKDVPPNWIPASRLEIKDGLAMPDSIGHTPGWIPVELNSRQHCWHLSAVNLVQGFAMVLRVSENSEDLVIETEQLSNLCGQTCELIGTNINANPYGLGSKKYPLHLFVPHGSMTLTCPHPSDYDAMVTWFNEKSRDVQVEGIVWHCANGELHKLHRHHLNLKWPVSEPRLCQKKVKVQIEMQVTEDANKVQGYDLFSRLSSLNGQTFDSLKHLSKALEEDVVPES